MPNVSTSKLATILALVCAVGIVGGFLFRGRPIDSSELVLARAARARAEARADSLARVAAGARAATDSAVRAARRADALAAASKRESDRLAGVVRVLSATQVVVVDPVSGRPDTSTVPSAVVARLEAQEKTIADQSVALDGYRAAESKWLGERQAGVLALAAARAVGDSLRVEMALAVKDALARGIKRGRVQGALGVLGLELAGGGAVALVARLKF